jgi:hypothetical protein
MLDVASPVASPSLRSQQPNNGPFARTRRRRFNSARPLSTAAAIVMPCKRPGRSTTVTCASARSPCAQAIRPIGRRGIGHVRGRCRKSQPERVRPAPARLGLPVKRLTFLAVVIAEAVGMLAGRRGFALRFAGEAAVAAAVAVLEAVVDAGRPRRCRRGSVDRHQRHARNRNRRSQPVDSAQFHSPWFGHPLLI